MTDDDTVDSWFVRFRQTGDPAALALVFDQTAPEILRLAGHLVRDPHVAEDLLQQTFLTAIERAASFDEERRVRPWLIGILVQLVRRHHRARGRQPDADRLPVRSAESPVDHAEAAELSATLEQELGRLPAPYQPVLALHLRHGLSAHEIASALRRPQGTVRTQLMRGLELLRRALPVGLAVTAVFGTGAAQALATARTTVLAQASGSVAVAAGPALLGGVLVGKNVGVAAAVLVALVGAGLWLWPAERPATPSEPVALAPSPQRAAVEAPAAAPAARRQANVIESRPTVAAGSTGALAVRVLWSDRTPAADVGVLVRPQTGDGDLHRRWCDTGPAGELRLDELTPGRYSLATDRGGRITSEVRADATTQAELLVPAGVQVECEVVDREGAPIPQALVWLALHPESVDDGRVVGRTGADGTLRLRDVEPGRLVSAAARTFVWCRCQFVEGAPGARQSLRLMLRGVAATLRGRVVDGEGTPVAGCLVRLGQSSPVQRIDKVFGVPALPWTTCTDAAGAFRVEHLSSRDLPIWARAPGFAIATTRVQLAEDRDNEVVIRLVRGGSLTGVVLDPDGTPCRAHVSAQGEAGGDASMSGLQAPGWAWPFPGAATDADGRFRLAGLRPGPTLFRAEAETGAWAQSELRIEDGKELTWEARLTRGADITGLVVDASDKPLHGWRVIATASGKNGRQGEARTAADGRFTITGREPVPHQLSVSPLHGGMVRAGVHEVTPGQPPLTIRVPADQLPTAFLTCTVADPEGRPLRDARVTPHRAGTFDSLFATADADAGRFTAGPMPPGRYVVHVAHEKLGNLRSEEIALAADETRDAGELRFPQPGTFVATVTGPEGRPVSGIAVLQEPGSPYPATMGMLSDGVLRSKPVRPGNYVLALFRAESPLCGWPVEIRPGQVTPVEAQIPKGVRRAVRYTRLGEPAPASLTFRWFDARGVLIQYSIQQWDQAERPGHDQWFAPGTWRVVVESASGRTAETTIVIPDLAPSSEELLIRLP